MLAPLPWRWIAGVTTIAALFLAVWMHGYYHGTTAVRKKWDDEKAQAVADAQAESNRRVMRLSEAESESRLREAQSRAAAGAARSELERLRIALAANSMPEQSASAAQRDTASTELFGECATALRDMAEKADAHASDAVRLRDAWP